MSLDKNKVQSSSKKKDIWTYERFVVGQVMGSSVELICPETIEKWDGIYGSPVSGDRVHLGLAQLVVMRVYTEVVQPRPPGNLHVGQTVEIKSAPYLNESMIGEVRCSEKCLKGDRKLVVFQVDVSGHESAAYLFKGKISIFWAR